jgi:FkbM family methyltransferase
LLSGAFIFISVSIAPLAARRKCYNLFMHPRVRYEIRGLAYWAECANPFRNTVTARHLPLGLRMQGYKRDCVGRGLYRRGLHEPGLTKYLLETYSNTPGGNFLDVGANIGYFSCLLGKLAGPTGKVVSVEPEPQNRQLLETNLRNNALTNVTVHPCAVGSEEGTARMGIYKPANRGRHSLVDLEPCKKFIQVPVRRLDDLLQDSAVKSWTLMKMDVEGFEPFVFAGGAETLARTESLALEYAPAYWEKANIEPAIVFQTLSAHFSRIDRFYHLDLQPITAAECAKSEITLDLLLRR